MRLSLLPLIALLAACGGEPATETTSSQPAATAESRVVKEPQDLEVFVLDCGEIDVADLDLFATDGSYAGQTDTFTDTCYLVRHPKGDLLWDLGLPGTLAGSEPYTEGPFTVSLERTIADQLADLDIAPSDIDFVAISHMHFDHMGQAGDFPDAVWLAQSAEYDAMFTTDDAGQRQANDPTYAPFLEMEAREYDAQKDVFGDGTVIIRHMPGHTPGHSILQVMLPENGPMLFTGDMWHRAESREGSKVPRFNWDVENPPADGEPGDITRRSMAAVEALADELGAQIVIQHEPLDIARLPTPPASLK
jgi:glyoxylase-like metal-dependent hydrolase (beta-lactamase superfamily II)